MVAPSPVCPRRAPSARLRTSSKTEHEVHGDAPDLAVSRLRGYRCAESWSVGPPTFARITPSSSGRCASTSPGSRRRSTGSSRGTAVRPSTARWCRTTGGCTARTGWAASLAGTRAVGADHVPSGECAVRITIWSLESPYSITYFFRYGLYCTDISLTAGYVVRLEEAEEAGGLAGQDRLGGRRRVGDPRRPVPVLVLGRIGDLGLLGRATGRPCPPARTGCRTRRPTPASASGEPAGGLTNAVCWKFWLPDTNGTVALPAAAVRMLVGAIRHVCPLSSE